MLMTPDRTNAIITASYDRDFERCAILCESIDRHVTGHTCHYLLVDGPDVPLFSRLVGPKRRIITDTELMPWWFRRLPQQLLRKRKRAWISPFTSPMHGWQVQQMLRIAVASLIDDDGLFYCDSDTAFVRPFDLSSIWNGASMRLYRNEHGARSADNDHMIWRDHAAVSVGIDPATSPDHDYVCSFVTWRRQTVLDMCAHMETVHGKSWVSVVGRSRKFSECMLYGAYVDGVLAGKDHHVDNVTYCPMRWFNPAPSDAEMAALLSNLTEHQAGIGIQSFIPMDAQRFRDLALGKQQVAA